MQSMLAKNPYLYYNQAVLNPLKNKVYQLLRQSESFFKTDMIYLAKGGFWLTMGQVAAAISSFVLAVAFANLLPKETYGTYKYILAIGSTLAVFSLTGMYTSVTQAVAKGSEGVLMPAFRTRLQWGLLGSLVSLIGSVYYYLNGNLTLSAGLIIIGIFMPVMEAANLYTSVWHGRKRFDISTKYFLIGQLASVSLSILALLFTSNVLILTIIYFASWTILRAYFFKLTVGKVPEENTNFGTAISYGKHLSLMGVVGVVANYADRILVFHYVGAVEAAIYTIALAIPEQVKSVFKNIGSLALPKFSERAEIKIGRSVWYKICGLVLILLATTASYFFLAPTIFHLLFPQYLDSIFYSQLYILSLVTVISIIPISFLQAQKRTRDLYLFNTLTPIIQIIILFIGAYFYGLIGVVIAKVLSKFISMFISIIFVTK